MEVGTYSVGPPAGEPSDFELGPRLELVTSWQVPWQRGNWSLGFTDNVKTKGYGSK